MKQYNISLESEMADYVIKVKQRGRRVIIDAEAPFLARALARQFVGAFAEPLDDEPAIGFHDDSK